MFSFEFWVRYLKLLSILLTLQGLSWALIGSFDPFGIYDSLFAHAMFGVDVLPTEVQRAKAFLLGPFGATDAGFFVLFYFIAAHGFARREAWAYRALLAGVGTWFVVDTIMSLVHGMYFNIYLVNIPAGILLGLPLFFTRGQFDS